VGTSAVGHGSRIDHEGLSFGLREKTEVMHQGKEIPRRQASGAAELRQLYFRWKRDKQNGGIGDGGKPQGSSWEEDGWRKSLLYDLIKSGETGGEEGAAQHQAPSFG